MCSRSVCVAEYPVLSDFSAGCHRADVVGRMLESVLNQMYNMATGNRIFDCRLVATSTLWNERWLRWSLAEAKDALVEKIGRVSCPPPPAAGRSEGSIVAAPQSPALCGVVSVCPSLQDWFDNRMSPITGVGFQPIGCRYGHSHCHDATYGNRRAYDGWLNVYKALGHYIAVPGEEYIFSNRLSSVEVAFD